MRQTRGTIEEHVVVDGVLVEQASAGTEDGLAVLPGIPGNTKLGREVEIVLTNGVAEIGEIGQQVV